MDILKNIVLILLFSLSIYSHSQKKENTTMISKDKIDDYLTEAKELFKIPGLAVAVIENDNVVYKNFLGKASLENNNLVDSNTLFGVFSASKLFTAIGVFQLIEKGKLALEDYISKYLDNLPVEWQKVKIKNLLTHSSGIPNLYKYENSLSDEELMERLFKDKMEFAIGSQFSFNQTNNWLLSRIIEKITETEFDEYIIKNQFNNNTEGVIYSSNSYNGISNHASRYVYNKKSKKFTKGTNFRGKRANAGNGLNISLKQFIEWDKKLKNNTLLSEVSKAKMWSPFQFTNNFNYQKDHFLHGWHNYYVNGLNSFSFSGNNLVAYRYFPKSKTTIILLTNGYEIAATDTIVNDIARMISSKKIPFKKR